MLTGFAVAAAGGPVALAVIYLPGIGGLPPRLLPFAAVLGFVGFLPALAVWRRYAAVVASDGGLYAFARRAAGPRLAAAQGWLWTAAYLLYLPYTVAYVVYLELPHVAALPGPAAAALELALPALSVLAVVRAERGLVTGLAVLGGVELCAVAASVPLGWHAAAWAPGPGAAGLLPARAWGAWAALLGGAVQVSSLFVCLSLVVFLGGAASGGAPAVRRSLGRGGVLAGVATVLAALVLARQPAAAGYALAAAGPAAWATAYRLLALGSTLGLVLAEFVALVRLGRAMPGWPRCSPIVPIAAVFLGGAAVSLLGPARFYALTLPPSLLALWLSMLLVFAVYPRFAQRHRSGGLRPGDVALAALGCLWAGWGAVGALQSLLHALGPA